MDSLSERMSPKFLVPNTFLRVVAANSLDRLVKKKTVGSSFKLILAGWYLADPL